MSGSDQRAGWELGGAERERYVRELFDRIAGPYDRLNRVISLGGDRRWRRRLVGVSGAGPGSHVVDLGTGTGDLAFDFARVTGAQGCVVGVDLSVEMLRVARRKVGGQRAGAPAFVQARAEATGLPDGWADAVSMGWVLRNVGDRPAVYREIRRLLRPGGRFLAVDMSRPSSRLARAGFWVYRHLVMPGLARLSGGDADAYRYLAGSTDRFPDAGEIERELRHAGFSTVFHRSLMLGSVVLHVAER